MTILKHFLAIIYLLIGILLPFSLVSLFNTDCTLFECLEIIFWVPIVFGALLIEKLIIIPIIFVYILFYKFYSKADRTAKRWYVILFLALFYVSLILYILILGNPDKYFYIYIISYVILLIPLALLFNLILGKMFLNDINEDN